MPPPLLPCCPKLPSSLPFATSLSLFSPRDRATPPSGTHLTQNYCLQTSHSLQDSAPKPCYLLLTLCPKSWPLFCSSHILDTFPLWGPGPGCFHSMKASIPRYSHGVTLSSPSNLCSYVTFWTEPSPGHRTYGSNVPPPPVTPRSPPPALLPCFP